MQCHVSGDAYYMAQLLSCGHEKTALIIVIPYY